MTPWQRKARLLIAVFAIVFAALVAWQLKPRVAPRAPTPVVHTDPGAVFESTGGKVERVKFSKSEVVVEYQRQLLYANGSAKLSGVTIHTDERGGNRTFTVTAKEGTVGEKESTLVLDGDVRVAASDGLTVRTEHATYEDKDGIVRAPGPATFARGRMNGSGVGMRYDKARDVLTILQQAVVHIGRDEKGDAGADVTSGSAEYARRDRIVRFVSTARIDRGNQIIEAENATAFLSEDSNRIESLTLVGNARITVAHPTPGALQAMSGSQMTLKYASNQQVLESAEIVDSATIQVAGEEGQAGREIAAKTIDVTLAPDGSTPTALVAREAVRLVIPADATTAARTIRAAALDAKGQPGRGLTRAVFTGGVEYRESGASANRAVGAGALDVGLKPGLSSFEDARFSRAVHFEEGRMVAVAALGRYDPDKGTLELSGSEPGAAAPRVVNEQIAVDAAKIDVTLDGPKVHAVAAGTTDKVKSVLQPAQKPAADGTGHDAQTKMPSMLKQDQPVNVTASALEYDGSASKAVYTGGSQLWQGDTSIKGDRITIDTKSGDLAASQVTSTTMLEQTNAKDNKKERVRSVASAKELAYDDSERRLTYTGDAHMSSVDGDMAAAKIELYLKPSGDELDRAEGYDNVTLHEQNRKTTGNRMTYTTADDRYVIVGTPVKILDECERETTGKTLIFVKATDRIVIDGNQQIRTQTKGGGKCPS
jgi:LPS export ABC transporter protein LptC/lipopolysaccharide transport protein LptA